MGKPRYNTKNDTYLLPDKKSRYLAQLKPADNASGRFLLVAFEDMGERNTFTDNTAFEKLPAAKAHKTKKSVISACRNNPLVVFDQDAKPVTRITSLYKPLSQQRTDRPEDGMIPCMPTMRTGMYHNGKSKGVRLHK